MKYLYNGIELPALPEWDKEKYPYAIICFLDTPPYVFQVSTHKLCAKMFKDGGIRIQPDTVILDAEYMRWSFNEEEFAWGSPWTFTGGPGPKGAYWTNTDLTYKRVVQDGIYPFPDGALYLAASDPVPVGGVPVRIHLKSWLTGYALGLAGKPLPLIGKKKEPVAYLYNDVRLPKLPEWDKETYPYAYIVYVPYEGNSYGHVLITIRAVEYYTTIVNKRAVLANKQQRGKAFIASGDVWGEYEEISDVWYGNPIEDLLWTNFDVYSEDGTLFLAASEPVPVYE